MPRHAMVTFSRQQVNAVMQTTAKRHIELLNAATYSEDWHLGPDGSSNQREHRGITLRVDGFVLWERHPTEVVWFNVCSPPRQQQTIELRQQTLDI